MSERAKRYYFTLMVIGIVALVMYNIKLNSRLKSLEWSFNEVNSNVAQLSSNMNILRSDIMNGFDMANEQAKQNAKLSFNESVIIKKYDGPASTSEVEISFNLKEYNIGETVTVIAKGKSGLAYDAKAARSGTGRFTAAMTLPVKDNYALAFSTGGETTRTGELAQFNLANELCGQDRFKCNFGYSHSSGSGQTSYVTLQPYFLNETKGNDALMINDMSMSVVSGGEQIATWDLMPYIQNTGSTQILDTGADLYDAFRIAAGHEPGQAKPDKTAVARLVMSDNLGVKYERVDQFYIADNSGIGANSAGGAVRGGGSGSGGGGGGFASIPGSALTGSDADGDMPEWGFFRIVWY
jgi:outer membrane murein-binding lipoprotein Lpp